MIRRSHFLVSTNRWYDWINLARVLLQHLHFVHLEGIVLGDFNIESVNIQRKDSKIMPYIVDYRNACFGTYTSKDLLRRLPREEQATSARGFDDALMPIHVGPSINGSIN